ncbi:hypothetical protein C8Q80DRAFT_22778 [Daedaleopsis nitida]|nr:hypothetical protein C8Q80DRAFT_22778 [Daedaleopsis nitida]
MENARLPIDVCEQVIDRCWCNGAVEDPDPDLRIPDYGVLRATALVCSAWRPRSQYNMFSRVAKMDSQSRIDRLLRTLEEFPRLSDLITCVPIWAHRRYISLCQTPLLPTLYRCTTWEFCIDGRFFPPRYTDTVLPRLYGRQNVTHLTLVVVNSSVVSLLRFIWSLPRLQRLCCHTILNRDTTFLPLQNYSGAAPPSAVLESLHLRGDIIEIPFPPYIWGVSVTTLKIELHDWTPSDGCLQAIGAFRQLQTLQLTIAIAGLDYHELHSSVERLLSCLEVVESREHLRSLNLSLQPSSKGSYHSHRRSVFDRISGLAPPTQENRKRLDELHRDRVESNIAHTNYYTRHYFLDHLLEDRMLEILEGFPGICCVRFGFFENNSDCDQAWWREQITSRIPERLDAGIEVDLYMCDGQDGFPNLWHEEPLPDYNPQPPSP